MQLADRLTLDAPRRTGDGYMAVRARAARAGVYDYLASEVGAPDRFKASDTVKIYRDPEEVFAPGSVRSFIGRPITDDHPSASVTAANWRDHARGTVMGAVRDGEYLAFDLTLMDAAAIRAVEAGKRELSNGYSCTLDWTPGTTPDGATYDARQVGITGNHVALVDKGRAGPNCAIKDGEAFAHCDANPAALADTPPKGNAVKKIVLDGLQVDLSDADAVSAAIDKLQAKITDSAATIADLNTKLGTLTGEKVALEAKVKDAEALLLPAVLDKRVADRSVLIAQAKAVDPKIVTDGKTDAEIRRAAVTAKVGDAASTLEDAAIAGAFVVLAKDVKPAVENIGAPAIIGDAAGDYVKMLADRREAISNAWKKPVAARA